MTPPPSQTRLVKAVLLVASSLTIMGGAIISPGLANISRHFAGHPELMIQLVLTMPGLVIAVFSPLAGYIIDAMGRRGLLLASLLLYGVAGASGYLVDSLAALLATRAVLGIAMGGIMSATITLAGDYFRADERARFMGLQGSVMALGGVVFLNLGGVLADWSWRGPFLVYLVALIVLPMAAAVLHEPAVARAADRQEADPAVDLPRIAGVYLVAFVGMMVLYIVPTQLPFLVADTLQGDSRAVAIGISATTLTSALMSFGYARVKGRYSYPGIHCAAFVLIGIGFAVVGVSHTFWLMLLGVSISGFGFGLFMPNGSMWLMSITPERARGRVVGGFSSMMFLGQFMSPVAFAPAVRLFGFTGAFMTAAVACALSALLLIGVIARHRSRVRSAATNATG